MPNTQAQRARLKQLLGALDGTATDVDDVVNDLLQTDNAVGFIPLTMSQFVLAANGAPLVVWADGVNDGLDWNEGMGYRFDVGNQAAIGVCVPMPQNFDSASNVYIHVLASRVGTADTTAGLTATGFWQSDDALYDADADCLSGAGAAAGDLDAAASKTVQELIITCAAADIPAHPCAFSFTLVADANLDADDMIIHAVWLEFTLSLSADS